MDPNVGRRSKCRPKTFRKNEFPGMGWPGVENVPTPRGIILHLFPASQLPYSAKIQNLRNFGAGWPPIGADYPSGWGLGAELPQEDCP